MSVVETDVAAVKVSDAGATSQVNNYRILHLLGEGAFSRVYECENSDGNRFALKVLNKSFLKRKREYKRVDGKLVLSNAFQKVQKEVAIMKKLSHTHLVKLHEVIDSPADDKMFLVLDLIRGGQVMNWDDKGFRYHSTRTPTGVLGRSAVRGCLRDVVAALDYLHRNRICHRDIKPENILLSSAEEGYKLVDFGVAHMLEPEDESNRDQMLLRSTEGTYHFLAPECTTGEAYDPFQVDIWALGVTMFAMLKGTLPFGAKAASLDDVMTSIRQDALVLPDDLAPECSELLARMLSKSPTERITIPQLLAHPWLSGMTPAPPTPCVGAEGEVSTEDQVVVQVSAMEIEAAFTPVNNFILMTKLKMKMGTRLARARKSIGTRQELFGGGRAHARTPSQPRAPAVHPHTQAPLHRSSDSAITPVIHPLSDKEDKDMAVEAATTGDRKIGEVSSSEVSPGKPAAALGLQKRKSNLVDTFAETMDALASLRPAALLRRNSALAAPLTSSTKPEKATTLPGPATESAFLAALFSDQPEKPHADPVSETASVVTPDDPTDDNSAVPTVDGSRPVVSQCQQQPRYPRRGLGRRSSTVGARIGGTSESAQHSSPTFSDIPRSSMLVRRKSALSVVSPVSKPPATAAHQNQQQSPDGERPVGSCRSRSGSPSKVPKLEKLEVSPEKVTALAHQSLVGASAGLQQPCDRLDSREEAGAASDSPTTANTHEDASSSSINADADATTNHATSVMAALTATKEINERDLNSRPQSPSSLHNRRRSGALGSHPTLQAKLPPLDLSSAPSTPTARSPAVSPLAAGSPSRSRRASVDFPLRMSEVEELSSVDEGQPLSARLSPSRQHSLLERASAVEHHALPAFPGSLATLSTPSSPRTDAINRNNEVEFSLKSSCHGEFEDEANSTVDTLGMSEPDAGAAVVPLDRHAVVPANPSTSLSTLLLPRYHSPVPPVVTQDVAHQSVLEGESVRNLACSSSTGSLSPRHKLAPPTRHQVVPLTDSPATRDHPKSPTKTATASMVRMSSLAKALDTCLPPENNARYYSVHTTPQPPLPVAANHQETPGTNEDPSVEAEAAADVVAPPERRNNSRRRSLLEAQDSLKLMVRDQSSANLASPSKPMHTNKQLGWRAGGSGEASATNPPLTSVCSLM